MKRGTKIWLIMALILGLSGGALCIAAAAMGLSYDDIRDMADQGDFWVIKRAHITTVYEDDIDYQEEGSHHAVTAQDSLEKLLIDMDFGQLTIAPSDSDDIYLDAGEDAEYYIWSVDDETISVKNTNKKSWINIDMPQATLYVPEDTHFKHVEVDVDAGACSIETAIECDSLIIDVDAGSVDIGAMQAKQADFDCDAGKIKFDGSVLENGSAEGDAGAMEIFLNNKAVTDYNYHIKVGAGALTINEKNYSGLNKKDYINNGADADWTLDCDAGKIEMNIYK